MQVHKARRRQGRRRRYKKRARRISQAADEAQAGAVKRSDQHAGDAAFILVGVIQGQVRGEFFVWHKAKRKAGYFLIDVTKIIAVRRVGRRHEAVAVEGCNRCAGKQRVRDRHIDAAAQVNTIVPAGGDLNITVQTVVGLFGSHIDRAANRVPSEQRALRATRHLDVFDIHQIQHAAGPC